MIFPLANKPGLLFSLLGITAGMAYVWATWTPTLPAPAQARAPRVGAVESIPGGPQTPEYHRLQQMADQVRADQARATGGAAVPTPPQLHPLPTDAPSLSPSPRPSPPVAPPATSTPPAAAPLDPMDRLTAEFTRAMQAQTRELITFRERFEPKPTRMVTFEDVKGQRVRAESGPRAEHRSTALHHDAPHDRQGVLQPGDLLYAVLQTAINSDEPGPVRARIVGERFKGSILLGSLTSFPPVVGSRPERVLVKFHALTTPERVTYRMEAYALDLATARTALATDIDHHLLERWGALLAASFLEGYGNAVRSNHTITTVGPLGNVVSVPQDDLDHEDLVYEAMGVVGERLGAAVGEHFRRPNTITVAAGAGIGVLIVAPAARDGEPATAAGEMASPHLAASRTAGDAPRRETWIDRGHFPTAGTPLTERPLPVAATE